MLYTERFERALALAARSFRPVRRKGTDIPYLAHLMAVTVTVMEHGGDEDQQIAAVLHDYLEDVDGATVEGLSADYGPRVARLVHALSDATSRPKPPWEERKRTYLTHLAAEPAEVKLISAADKLHNARSILRDLGTVGDALWDRFTAPRDGTLWYYRGVVAALGQGWDHTLVDELHRTVEAIHQQAGVPWPADG